MNYIPPSSSLSSLVHRDKLILSGQPRPMYLSILRPQPRPTRCAPPSVRPPHPYVLPPSSRTWLWRSPPSRWPPSHTAPRRCSTHRGPHTAHCSGTGGDGRTSLRRRRPWGKKMRRTQWKSSKKRLNEEGETRGIEKKRKSSGSLSLTVCESTRYLSMW